MNSLVSVPKNGSLKSSNLNQNFPIFSSWLDDVFNHNLPTTFASNFSNGITLPKVNIKVTPESFVVEMAAPGLKKEDFQIHIDNQTLTISKESSEENEQNFENYTRREFGYSAFKRTFSLPESINEDLISANYQEGLLLIHLPKKEEAKKKPARNIEII
jgi:HSP20 family protein